MALLDSVLTVVDGAAEILHDFGVTVLLFDVAEVGVEVDGDQVLLLGLRLADFLFVEEGG